MAGEDIDLRPRRLPVDGSANSAGEHAAPGIEVRPIKAMTLFAEVNNLFDKRYAAAAQIGATGFDARGNFVARPFAAPVCRYRDWPSRCQAA